MTKKFICEIFMGNDAMQNTSDIATALEIVINKLNQAKQAGGIMDINGNVVGLFYMEDMEDDNDNG